MPDRQRPLRQPTIGILGGTSHVITSRYYDMLNAELQRELGGDDMAETLIMGMNFGNVGAFVQAGDWGGLEAYVEGKIDGLIAAGSDIILGVSNTVHEVMAPIMARKETPFLPISAPLVQAVKASGLERIAIFGTRSTMDHGLVMREVEEKAGVTLLTPNDAEKEEVHRVIFEELVKFQFTEESRERFCQIARRLQREQGAQGLILGCTEIMLLVGQDDLPDVEVFATAELHVKAAARWALDRIEG
ncbi:aspartate/glutamate racemase family protein [Parvularcula lutaonensis]|uniref:Aspartate/glutamate racemase family protein n=1 Tax=Parvularcula lutaonensis TaxID=491923 RepID=A0ABV7MD68_9PROT|nr:amino acid racemase [Parvularcula lutaonensis]GGY52348.1 aspartate racemase [Parvularcula lutaonensis]